MGKYGHVNKIKIVFDLTSGGLLLGMIGSQHIELCKIPTNIFGDNNNL